ncbi:MAG: hypothetical protein HYY78_17505 [Betaproteobacteria bacterium]|nr:hypothetical protein [Betaproteobacteria bacterium]
MTNQIIAVLLAISLAACSSAPRLPPTQPSNAPHAATSSSAEAREDAATRQEPAQTAESAQQRPDAVGENRSHLAEIGKGLVLVALIALLVWMHYYWAYAPYAR